MVLRQTFNLLVDGSNPSRPTIARQGFRSNPEPFFFSAIGLLFRKMVTPPPTNQQLVERQLKLAML